MRPTVVHSPDTLVFINGEQDILGCGSCMRRMDFNKFITSVQVDLSVDSVPGSASIAMSIPRHTVDDFFVNGEPIISPMMEIEIFSKGFFTVEGVPQYYPIFWGLITEVADNYSAGEHSVSINCSDILKWWELCKMNINPAFTQAVGQKGRSIYGNVFFGTNPYDIIWTLAQMSFGDVVVGSGSMVSLYKEASQKATFNEALRDTMQYWSKRFGKIRSNLLLYGTRGNVVRGDVLDATFRKSGKGEVKGKKKTARYPVASAAVRKANGGDEGSQMVYDPSDPNVVAFRTQFSQAGQVNFWQSEYQTKLELAQSAKEAIGFEFFMDVTGDIVFKPPFYNLDILQNKPVSWIQDIDIIDWNLSESEAEVVTQVQIQGSYRGNIDYGLGEEVTPFTSVTDYHLLRKYGWRTQTFNSEFMGSPLLMFYTGLDLIDRYNSRRFRGTVNIPLRPELRLGFPIYLASKDQIWYINGISHNISYGGQAQTTLSLTAKRGKFTAPTGIGSIELVGYSGKKSPKDKSVTDLYDKNALLTARQLAEGARFKAKIGDAAELPPVNRSPEDEETAKEAKDKKAVAAKGTKEKVAKKEVKKTAKSTVAKGENPYKPMILRHPKTGRIVGHPNVVLMYTRPFTPPPTKLNELGGRKGGKKARAVVKTVHKNLNASISTNLDETMKQLYTVQKDDELREQLVNNRYSYGLNSAGVYTYMHDKSQVIQEILLLPVANIEFDEETQKKQLKGKTGMMRPVSDERGFEVIGHWRYGRKVSLRDGQLVLNKGKVRTVGTDENRRQIIDTTSPGATNNSRASVSSTQALSGDLYTAIRAQSSGLSTISASYPNPAQATMDLLPEDLQAAGIASKDNPKTYEFSNDGVNFVDVAPLGSPEQAGSVNASDQVSVEASQLSHALTLAEMRVRDEILDDTNCACLLGRSDLAFINTGYQLQSLNEAGGSNASLGDPESQLDDPAKQEYQARRKAVVDDAIEKAGETAQQQLDAGIVFGEDFQDDNGETVDFSDDEYIKRAKASAGSKAGAFFDKEPANLALAATFGVAVGGDAANAPWLIAEALAEGRPVSEDAFSAAQTMSRVEDFLATLYQALDGPHQEHEKVLRGEFINDPRPSAKDIRFNHAEPPGGVAPPFSPASRALGGDLKALALQVHQAGQEVEDVDQSWDKFADELKSKAVRGQLTGTIELQERKVIDLQAAHAKLEADKTLTGGSRSARLRNSSIALDEAKEDLGNSEHKLRILNAEFPP